MGRKYCEWLVDQGKKPWQEDCGNSCKTKKKKKNLDKEIMDIVVVLPFEHINFSSSKFKTNAFIDVDLT